MAYDALDFPRERMDEILREFNQLMEELEKSFDTLSEEEKTVLDGLDDDLAELSELQEGKKDTPPLAVEKLLELDLQTALRTVIAEFRPTKIGDLQMQCQKLIDHHGFATFRETFDALLIQAESLKSQELRAMKHINRYLMNRMADTFAAIAAEGSKTYAKSIIDVLNLNQYFRVEGLEAAKTDSNKAKEMAIKKVETEAAQAREEIRAELKEKIEAIKKQGQPEETQKDLIENANEEATQKLTAINKETAKKITAIKEQKDCLHLVKELTINLIQAKAAQEIEHIKKQEPEGEQEQLIEQVNKATAKEIDAINAQEDRLQLAREMASKLAQTEAFAKIRDINQKVLTEAERNQLIEQVNQETSAEINAIQQMEVISPDYYVRAERRIFEEQVFQAAEKDGYQKAKKLTIKAIESERDKKIEELKQQELPENETLIEQVKKEAAEQIAAIEQMKTMPLDYYIEAARRKMLVDDTRKKALFQRYDKIADFVLKDILSRESMDERTLVMERYLLITEKLMAQKHYDAALPIFGALQQTPIFRLAKTKEGLSTHAQHVLEKLGELQNDAKNFAAIRGRCERENTYVPLNFTVTDITFSTDDVNPFILDSKGKIVRGCDTLPGMERIISNCVKAAASKPSEPDNTLSLEMEAHREELATKTKKEIETAQDKASQQCETRGALPEASTLLSKSKLKKLIHLGIVVPPKRSEQTRKIEEAFHDLKNRIQSKLDHLKNLVARYEDKAERKLSSIVEKMQNAVTPLFERIHTSLKDSIQNSSQRFREFMLSSKKEKENEDQEGERPHTF
ncbi:hypothetical protein OQJ26_10245 [Legionella sp. PATHC038]|uniref:RasGEF domain-containing protein n=1 Tax=Legionella sheltonii TaxID=2992041 RepID=UPI002242FEAA|nr:RasGEF domain-containing protein [Legionella sp. PATHC038]MCW8399170.1 hypothetical protein [Legionella sp. PATHC038]